MSGISRVHSQIGKFRLNGLRGTAYQLGLRLYLGVPRLNVRQNTSYTESFRGISPYLHVELALCLNLRAAEMNTRGSTGMCRVYVVFLNYGLSSYHSCQLSHSRISQITLHLIQQQ